MAKINFEKNKITGFYQPTQYPVRQEDHYESMMVPEGIRSDFYRLTSLIEDKYTKEYLKICAFYNKLFPSLKDYDWSRSSYNTVPFTLQDQERTDTGTGLSSNYLKGIIDLVVSRVGNTTFDYKLTADVPTALYLIYRDEIERVLKATVRKHKLNRIAVESFHDAAILGFSHVFIDPWSHEIRKITDWELGVYESEFADGKLKRVLIRDWSFPVSALGPYIHGFNDEKVKNLGNTKQRVDLRLYIDCFRHKKYVAIGSDMGPETDYPFDHVLLSSFSWDLGVRKTTVSSLFDLLYPLQRALNKLLAKKTQLLVNYKGPVPVFNRESEVVVKQIGNAAGECLFLDTVRDPAELMTVLQPTPLDPQLSAEVEALKGQMFELAGVQNISLELESMRSAAQMVALNQYNDSGFQSQLASLAHHIQEVILYYIQYKAVIDEGSGWEKVHKLIDEAYIDVLPVHDNDATGGAGAEPEELNYQRVQVERFVAGVLMGEACYCDLNFTIEPNLLRQVASLRLVQIMSVGGSEDCAEVKRLIDFLMMLYVEDMKLGNIMLAQPAMAEGELPPMESLPPPEEGGGEEAPIVEGM